MIYFGHVSTIFHKCVHKILTYRFAGENLFTNLCLTKCEKCGAKYTYFIWLEYIFNHKFQNMRDHNLKNINSEKDNETWYGPNIRNIITITLDMVNGLV